MKDQMTLQQEIIINETKGHSKINSSDTHKAKNTRQEMKK